MLRFLFFSSTFALIIPCLLAAVFTLSTVVGQRQRGISCSNHERSYPFAMLILISLQLFDRLAFFTELMSRNFNFEVISGDMESGVHLEDALHIWFQISHEFFLCSPLYIATVLLLVIRNYRQRLFESGRRLLRTLICADRKDKIDYACETMRSIIAKQTHAKRMKSFARPTIS
ncbi:hypothetical protein Tcan_02329 [Toxocara canis]|uniref:G_PROTEIN_RECEP_F1_2 domain-containing protein n=1 Tax=Toxocara canis TaxID=6265 RepID=A0A0B2UPR3_TOXCA|nr:hypothetical protein Tcan_02329 [Toxocara canis]